MTFSEDVTRLRGELGLSQSKLSRELDVTNMTIYNWEKGLCEPLNKEAVLKKIEGML